MRWRIVVSIILSCLLLIKVDAEEREESTVEEIGNEEAIEVTLEGLGKLKGKTGEARNNEIFYQFLGVPFAAPPVGANRFRPPAPLEPWEGTKDATENGKTCIQIPYLVPLKIVYFSISSPSHWIHLQRNQFLSLCMVAHSYL